MLKASYFLAVLLVSFAAYSVIAVSFPGEVNVGARWFKESYRATGTDLASRSRSVVTAKFPYGESSFGTIKSENSFFVDKTKYIRTLEASGKYIKIWRPRRFGKTLFCDMLAQYYDAANSKDKVFFP